MVRDAKQSDAPLLSVPEQKLSLKNPKLCKESMSSLTFLSHPSILQFLIAYFSFVSDYKDLKLALIIQINQLFQL